MKSVLLLFLVLGTQQIDARGYCNGYLKLSDTEEMRLDKEYATAPPRYTKKEKPKLNCILVIRLTGNVSLYPPYIKFTFENLQLKEAPLQIKTQRGQKNKWYIQARYSNVFISKIDILVGVGGNNFIKLIVPRMTGPNSNVQIQSATFADTSKISRKSTLLLGHCGLTLRQVTIKECTEIPMRITCTFECKEGTFPLYIDDDIYPSFTGYCEIGKTENWPQRNKPLCVKPKVVIRNCLSGAVNDTLYTGQYEPCPYKSIAMLRWFDEHIKTPISQKFSALEEIQPSCPEGCYSVLNEQSQAPSLCDMECLSITENGVTSYTPKCMMSDDWLRCMSCRYPSSSSACKRLEVFGKK